jgi:hypothetical protein
MNERRAFLKSLVGSAVPSPPVADPSPPAAEESWIERYSRQLVLPEWSEAAQRALGEASVLVVGAGALGSPVATYLAGAGVGRLGIVDDGGSIPRCDPTRSLPSAVFPMPCSTDGSRLES